MTLRRTVGAPVLLRLAARLALFAELAAIVWLASRGGARQRQIQSFAMLDDKAAHALAFLVAGLTGALAFRRRWPTVLGLCAAAGGIELLQLFIPERTASVADAAASLAGVAAGAALGFALRPMLVRRIGAATPRSKQAVDTPPASADRSRRGR